jgi:hypothetical protein
MIDGMGPPPDHRKGRKIDKGLNGSTGVQCPMRLPNELISRLDKLAAHRNVSRSLLIRELVIEGLPAPLPPVAGARRTDRSPGYKQPTTQVHMQWTQQQYEKILAVAAGQGASAAYVIRETLHQAVDLPRPPAWGQKGHRYVGPGTCNLCDMHSERLSEGPDGIRACRSCRLVEITGKPPKTRTSSDELLRRKHNQVYTNTPARIQMSWLTKKLNKAWSTGDKQTHTVWPYQTVDGVPQLPDGRSVDVYIQFASGATSPVRRFCGQDGCVNPWHYTTEKL